MTMFTSFSTNRRIFLHLSQQRESSKLTRINETASDDTNDVLKSPTQASICLSYIKTFQLDRVERIKSRFTDTQPLIKQLCSHQLNRLSD